MKRLRMLFCCLVLAFVAGGIQTAAAQCAQCAAQVETNKQNGDSVANGLNNGILYLLTAPYLAVAVVGFIWYKKYRRKNIELNMRNEKLHLN